VVAAIVVFLLGAANSRLPDAGVARRQHSPSLLQVVEGFSHRLPARNPSIAVTASAVILTVVAGPLVPVHDVLNPF
jgi:hypothetical protein